jgi:rhodanese-related sulfurtransferase
MEIWQLALAIVIGLSIGLLLSRNKNVDYDSIFTIKEADFLKNMRKGQLIDIRKKDAFEKDKIKGARNFKVSKITGKYTPLRKDLPIFLYCKNGKKSKRVAKKLSKANYKTIYILEGGFNGLKG